MFITDCSLLFKRERALKFLGDFNYVQRGNIFYFFEVIPFQEVRSNSFVCQLFAQEVKKPNIPKNVLVEKEPALNIPFSLRKITIRDPGSTYLTLYKKGMLYCWAIYLKNIYLKKQTNKNKNFHLMSCPKEVEYMDPRTGLQRFFPS